MVWRIACWPRQSRMWWVHVSTDGVYALVHANFEIKHLKLSVNPLFHNAHKRTESLYHSWDYLVVDDLSDFSKRHAFECFHCYRQAHTVIACCAYCLFISSLYFCFLSCLLYIFVCMYFFLLMLPFWWIKMYMYIIRNSFPTTSKYNETITLEDRHIRTKSTNLTHNGRIHTARCCKGRPRIDSCLRRSLNSNKNKPWAPYLICQCLFSQNFDNCYYMPI